MTTEAIAYLEDPTPIPPLPTGPFTTIVADPPWASMHQRSTYHRGKPERHYPTMPTEDICALPVAETAAEDAHLWVWGVNRLMEDAYAVVRAWGFTPISLLTWCKRGPGMGYYLRNNTEHCIFATRGRPMVPDTKLLSSWFEWPRLRHSEKPGAFYAAVETVSPGPYLEMFARRTRPGWTAWGNDVQEAPLSLFDEPAAGARQAEPVAVPCVECGHPQTDHGEGEDPVTPGQCRTCPDDDAWHDYQAAAVRQDGVQ